MEQGERKHVSRFSSLIRPSTHGAARQRRIILKVGAATFSLYVQGITSISNKQHCHVEQVPTTTWHVASFLIS